jgi:hypothetical protein
MSASTCIAVRVSVVGAMLLARVCCARASGPPDECSFRGMVVLCGAIVAGVIVSTEEILPSDAAAAGCRFPANRVSHLVVKERVFGTCAVGDTLSVAWTDLDAIGVSLGETVLKPDTWTGARALWLLGVEGSLWRPFDAIMISDARALQDRLSWFRNPPECDESFYTSALAQARTADPDAEPPELRLLRMAEWIAKSLATEAGSLD